MCTNTFYNNILDVLRFLLVYNYILSKSPIILWNIPNILYNVFGDDMKYYYILINGINEASNEDLVAIKHLFQDMMTNPQFNLFENKLSVIDCNKQDISFLFLMLFITQIKNSFS